MLKKVTAEFLGSLLLAASVVGSGIMATTLTQDIAIQLFVNTITTVFMLFVIITLFSSISGAHFNPLVTIVELFYKRVTFQEAALFIVSQIIGTSAGVVIVFTNSWIAISWVKVVAMMPEPTTLAASSKEPRNSAVTFFNIFILHMWT